ncbi:hypothetical protein pb186bvf_015897 [Paramecium bursaria]
MQKGWINQQLIHMLEVQPIKLLVLIKTPFTYKLNFISYCQKNKDFSHNFEQLQHLQFQVFINLFVSFIINILNLFHLHFMRIIILSNLFITIFQFILSFLKFLLFDLQHLTKSIYLRRDSIFFFYQEQLIQSITFTVSINKKSHSCASMKFQQVYQEKDEQFNCIYLWSAHNNKVIKFCDFDNNDMVCSLVWSPQGNQLAVGTGSGETHLYDQVKMKRISVLEGHTARVGSLAWSGQTLCSGSKDRSILMHDPRQKKPVSKLEGHKQEVCGLKWSPDEYQFASGGNDNKLIVWRMGSQIPLAKFTQHQAAVKAIAWSPHRHGLLSSGGGTADRTIRFFNTLTTQQLDWIDTGSQVCNLLSSKNVNEFVSTHGYSMNQIVCWKYPSLEKVTTLMGHTSRSDGETIVTGAGDETLRFWNVFPKKEETKEKQTALIPLNIR